MLTPAASLKHVFVDHVPASLDEYTLYVSIRYATVAHRCCCGCGREVVTPLTPTDWSLRFDGETITLDPSIGNWQFECRSHYWIRRSTVRWAEPWSEAEIDAGRARDRLAKGRYYGHGAADHGNPVTSGEVNVRGSPLMRLWRRLTGWKRMLRAS